MKPSRMLTELFFFYCHSLPEQTADQIMNGKTRFQACTDKIRVLCIQHKRFLQCRTFIDILATAYLLRNLHTERRELRISNR